MKKLSILRESSHDVLEENAQINNLRVLQRDVQEQITRNFTNSEALVAYAQSLRIEMRMIREEFYSRHKVSLSP